jgi:hypothetical protein|tara:strand:+ start:22 stop:1773 length:1752 start_codon:yes stop_codon:yes gene_type:complete
MAEAKYTLDDITPGPPTKFSYTEIATGEKIVRNSKFPEGEVVGDEPATGGDEAVTSGHTTFVDPTGENATQSLYGKNTIKSRDFKFGDPEEITNLGPGVRSLYNKWSIHNYNNRAGGVSGGKDAYLAYNKAVTQGGEAELLNPTARRIVNYSQEQGGIGYSYKFQDFAATEHYGQISNEYLITLRRFAYPCGDDIMNVKGLDSKGDEIDLSQPDLARALTWMSPELGNDMKEVLKFGTGFGWKDVESQIQEVAGNSQSRGKLGAMMDSSSLGRAVEAGLNGKSAAEAQTIRDKGAGFDPMKETYPNKVFGPLNVIKKVLAREQGLEFDSEFNLVFHYDIKGIAGTSPKVAFMDQLSNILALTYNNAPFWGGAVRYTGSGSVGKPFGDYDKLKNGDYAGFMGSLTTQLKSSMGSAFDDIGKAASGLLNGKGLNALGDSKIMDNIVGGGLMKLMNGPQGGTVINAFLTGDPTGQWHMTVGNPMNPMMVCGNLALQKSEVEFEGPLSYEGFPSKLKLTMSLKPARPRDKGEIESMFNAGRGRVYLQPEVEGSVDLDAVVDVSAYGNKDRKKFTKGFAEKLSNFGHG